MKTELVGHSREMATFSRDGCGQLWWYLIFTLDDGLRIRMEHHSVRLQTQDSAPVSVWHPQRPPAWLHELGRSKQSTSLDLLTAAEPPVRSSEFPVPSLCMSSLLFTSTSLQRWLVEVPKSPGLASGSRAGALSVTLSFVLSGAGWSKIQV